MKNETKYKLENKANIHHYRLMDAGMLSRQHNTVAFQNSRGYTTEYSDPQNIKGHRMEIKLEIKTARYGTRLEKDAIYIQGVETETGKREHFWLWKKNGEYFISFHYSNNLHSFCPLVLGNICGEVMRDAIIAAADENAKAEKAAKKVK